MSGVPGIRVVAAVNAIVTDLGRPGGPAVGLPVNGAMDQFAARVANVLVGNDEHRPLIETTGAGVVLEARADLLVSVTGALAPVSVDGVARPSWEPVSVEAGQTLEVGPLTAGLRAYVAVHGGLVAPLLRGSCAPDSGTGFGIRLAPGVELDVAATTAPLVNPYFESALYNLGLDAPFLGGTTVVDVIDGPDIGEFGLSAGRLFSRPYTVGARSNHVGLRMTGPLPERETRGEMISRGVPMGAVEVPPGDEILVLHRGRGVTAGYPVLAVVTSSSLDALAQVAPGQDVVFRRVELRYASESARRRSDTIASLRTRVTAVFSSLGRADLTPGAPRYHATSTPLDQGIL